MTSKFFRNNAGFTLVELMIVVTIVAILARIAIPSYQAALQKTRRSEAKTILTVTAQRLERCFSQFGNYNPNGTCQTGTTTFNSTPNGYYSITVRFCTVNPGTSGCTAAATGTAISYFLTATAQSLQTKDARCATFTLDNAGTRVAKDSSGAVNTTTCW